MPESDPPIAAREVLTPSSLNRLARDLIEDALPLIWLEGEVSNFTRSGPGHLYFSLKDSAAFVRCAMFKPRSTWLRFKPADGMHVVARGRVTLYEARGEFQLVVEHLEEAGEGALRREFELLKARLAAEGLFDPARKRPLPRFARRIGVVTSPGGAAIRDVLSVIARRFPLANVELLAIPVQGREAPQRSSRVSSRSIARRAPRRAAADARRRLARGPLGVQRRRRWRARSMRARSLSSRRSAMRSTSRSPISSRICARRRRRPQRNCSSRMPPISRGCSNATGGASRKASARKLQALQQQLDHAFARLHAQRPQARLARARERARALVQQLRSIGRSRDRHALARRRTAARAPRRAGSAGAARAP